MRETGGLPKTHLLPTCQNRVRAGSTTRGLRIGAHARHRGLVRRQRARRRVVVLGEEGREVRLRERVRRPAGRVRPVRDQRHRPGAGTDGPLPRRVEPGGVPRPFRGVRAARRGRGATPAALGLLPRSPVDRARLRGRGRGAVCDPDGRFALGPGVRYPVSELAARYGASVAEETSDWRQAYATVERFRRERPPNWACPPG